MSIPNIRLRERRPLRAPAARDISLSLLLLLASRASLLGTFPFGAAMFAACFDMSAAYIGIFVMCAGLFTVSAGIATVKYIIAALLFWIYTRLRPEGGKTLGSAACGIAVLTGGLSVLMYSYMGLYDIMILLVESITASIMYIIFSEGQQLVQTRDRRHHTSGEELISAAVCAGVFITGLADIHLPYGISLANIAASYIIMCVAAYTAIAAAGCGGMCIGFMSAVSTGGAVMMGGIYGVMAVFANLLRGFGRPGVFIGALGGAAIAFIYAREPAAQPAIHETLAGGLLFLATPKRAREYIKAFFSRSVKMEEISADTRMRAYLSARLSEVSRAFVRLRDCFVRVSDKRLELYGREIGEMFDEAASRSCEGCSMAVKCWQSDYSRTYKYVMLLLETIEKKGELTIENMPRLFRDKCIRSELFIMEFNHVYEMYRKELIRKSEAEAGRDMLAGQYGEIAALAEALSREIGGGFRFREDYEEQIVAEMDKHGIQVLEVSAVENEAGSAEVYLRLASAFGSDKTAEILSGITGARMGLDPDYDGNMLKFVTCPAFKAEVSVRGVKSDMCDVSGDSCEVFEAGGMEYVIISDGMGSGSAAAAQSSLTLSLLKEFLRAGFGIKSSISMINSALCLKLDRESFATIDLLGIDLTSGVAHFYKIGSARSLVYHNGEVSSVFSVSLPAGIMGGVHPYGQSVPLEDGDAVLMMSDGIIQAGYGSVRTEWIKKQALRSFETMEEMAQSVLDTAIKKQRGVIGDDMTVAAVRLIEL